MTAEVSLGLAATTPADTIREVAAAAEAAGLHSFWLNDTRHADAFAGLAAAASVTERIRLAVGVVALDSNPPERIAERIEQSGLPKDRLVLGIGSGAAPKAATIVAEGIRGLRGLVSVPIVVGALGPNVRRLGAVEADGLLLSWLSPATATSSADLARSQAADDGRPRPHIALYARAAVEAGAHDALRAEAERYARFPGYAANFARLGEGPLDGSILASDADELRASVAGYSDAVDELVLRAITAENSAAEIRRLIEAVAR